MTAPLIVNGYCVATTFGLERYHDLHGGGGGDYPDPKSKKVHAVKVTDGALEMSQYRDDAVRSAGGEQLLGARLQVEIDQSGAWKDWLTSVRNRLEPSRETCKRCKDATAGLAWEDVREGA